MVRLIATIQSFRSFDGGTLLFNRLFFNHKIYIFWPQQDARADAYHNEELMGSSGLRAYKNPRFQWSASFRWLELCRWNRLGGEAVRYGPIILTDTTQRSRHDDPFSPVF